MNSYQPGQAILGRIAFANSILPEYNRPYLIVKVFEDKVGIVDISSTQGKECKLLFSTNHNLENYNPPFRKPSFVKIDSYREISLSELSNTHLLSNGQCLNVEDTTNILNRLN